MARHVFWVEINPKTRSVPTRKASKYLPKCSVLLVFFQIYLKSSQSQSVLAILIELFIFLFVCDSFGLASLTALVPCVLVLNDLASFCIRLLALE